MKQIIILTALVLFSLPFITRADTTTAVASGTSEYGATSNPQYTLLDPLPGLNGNGTKTTIDIQSYIIYVFELAVALAVFLAVVMITWGGFKYMTVESVTGKSDAKEVIQNALFGLLGALGSYLILYTINPQLVDISLITIPKLNLKSTGDPLSNSTLAFQNALNQGNTNTAINTNAAAYTAQQIAQNNVSTDASVLYTSGCADQNGNDISNGDPTCALAWSQYDADSQAVATAVNQKTTQTAVVNMTAAENTFENTDVNQNFWTLTGGTTLPLGNTNSTDALTAIKAVDTTYNQASASVTNGDVTDTQALANQRTFQESNIVNDLLTNQAITNLDTDVIHNWTTSNAATAANIASANALITQLKNNTIPQYGATSANLLNTVQPLGTLDPSSTIGQQYNAANQVKISNLQKAVIAAGGTPN